MKDKRERDETKKMAVLTAECDRMFCVDKDQMQLFKKVEGNQSIRKNADIAVSKISARINAEGEQLPDDKT